MSQSANCPKCRAPTMIEMKTPDHVTLDFCEQCNGLWFDANELAEYLGISRDLMELDTVRDQARPTELACPRCPTTLVEMPFSADADLLIEYCTDCHGTFFDFREAAVAQGIAANQESSAARLSVIKQRFFSKGFS